MKKVDVHATNKEHDKMAHALNELNSLQQPSTPRRHHTTRGILDGFSVQPRAGLLAGQRICIIKVGSPVSDKLLQSVSPKYAFRQCVAKS